MARKPRTYRKLSGNGFSLLLKRSLWQGTDHLLWVEGGIAQEQYKRFYFKDIQALVLRRTRYWTVWALIWGVVFLLFGAIAVFSEGTAYVSSILAAMALILLGVHWLKGPSCEVFLQTAVHMQKLTNLVRVPRAMKVLNKIKAAAEESQGGPLGEQSLARLRSANVSQNAPPNFIEDQTPDRMDALVDALVDALADGPVNGPGVSPSTAVEDNAKPFSPKLHLILFSGLLLLGLLRCAQLWFKVIPLAVVDLFGLACTLVLGIIVIVHWLVRVRGSLLSFVSWLTLIFAVLHSMAAYGVFIAASIRQPNMAYNPWAVFKIFLAFQMEDQPIIQGMALGIAVISIALGLFGLTATLNFGHNQPVRSLPPSVNC